MQDTGVVQAYITQFVDQHHGSRPQPLACTALWLQQAVQQGRLAAAQESGNDCYRYFAAHDWPSAPDGDGEFIKIRSEEHTSELQSLMRISYAVFCLKKKNK